MKIRVFRRFSPKLQYKMVYFSINSKTGGKKSCWNSFLILFRRYSKKHYKAKFENFSKCEPKREWPQSNFYTKNCIKIKSFQRIIFLYFRRILIFGRGCDWKIWNGLKSQQFLSWVFHNWWTIILNNYGSLISIRKECLGPI